MSPYLCPCGQDRLLGHSPRDLGECGRVGGGRAGTVMVYQLGQRNDQETTLNEKIHQGGQHVKSLLVLQEEKTLSNITCLFS